MGHPGWYENAFTSLLTNISPNFNQAYLVEGCFVLILIGIAIAFFTKQENCLSYYFPLLDGIYCICHAAISSQWEVYALFVSICGFNLWQKDLAEYIPFAPI